MRMPYETAARLERTLRQHRAFWNRGDWSDTGGCHCRVRDVPLADCPEGFWPEAASDEESVGPGMDRRCRSSFSPSGLSESGSPEALSSNISLCSSIERGRGPNFSRSLPRRVQPCHPSEQPNSWLQQRGAGSGSRGGNDADHDSVPYTHR